MPRDGARPAAAAMAAGSGGQKHKAHKGGRKRHNERRNARAGHAKAPGRAGIKGNHPSNGRIARQQAAQANRTNARLKVIEEKRKASKGPPKVIALVPVCAEVDVRECWRVITEAARGPPSSSTMDSDSAHADAKSPADGVVGGHIASTFNVPDVKIRVTVLPPVADRSNLIALLDVAKVADVLLFLTHADASAPIDAAGLRACEALRAFGLPHVMVGVQGMARRSLSERSYAKKRCLKTFKDHVKESATVFPVDAPADLTQAFRTLKDIKLAHPSWRQHRPYIIVDACRRFQGGISLSGFIRGQNLSVHQAVHMPGVGDCNIVRIEAEADPLSRSARASVALGNGARGGGGDGTLSMEEDTVLAVADPAKCEGLARENVPDPLAGEQTWPTEEELAEADMMDAIRSKTVRLKVPKGYSDYQAAWIVSDDEDDDGSDSEGGAREEGGGVGGAGGDAALSDGGDAESMSGFGSDGEADYDNAGSDAMGLDDDADDFEMTAEDYAIAFEKERRERREAAQEDLDFPDEVDVPVDVAARERFIKYRGLKSFRTSPWDPRETLPRDYARIFAFENRIKAHKQAKAKWGGGGRGGGGKGGAKDAEGLVASGTYVRVFLAVSDDAHAAEAMARVGGASGAATAPPVVAFGLMQHETKISVLNFSVHKASSYADPIANKESLIFYDGIRTYDARPIISDSAPNVDKHKNQHFLRAGERATFSVYAPIAHPPMSLLCFKAGAMGGAGGEEGGGNAVLAAAGVLSSVDPDRIVLKRIILTGYPFKVHKSRAYIRYMFRSPEDVRYFRPLELWTKYGRRGKIREPVGTHGTMKCAFDGVVQQRDTVCLSLYKRVFPKWPGE